MATIPTCAVRVRLFDQNAKAVASASITALLDRYEIHDGFAVPQIVEAVTDAFGEATLNLWPNELGSQGSSYKIKIQPNDAKGYSTIAIVPDAPAAELSEISQLPEFPGKTDFQEYFEQAQGVANDLVNAANAAKTGAETAETGSATSATAAAGSVSSAAAQAAAALVSSQSATTSANASEASRINAAASATQAAASAASAASSDFAQSFKVTAGTGSGKNIIANAPDNDLPDDVSASVISGGGNSVNRNLIGYQQDEDWTAGTGANNDFTTSYDVTNTGDVTVYLVRADKVLVAITAQCDIVMNGGKAQITYPRAGHFVNDGTGGAEGANSFVLPAQRIWTYRGTKVKLTGSSANFCAIYGGYDNIQMGGIMNHQGGAHHRMKPAVNHGLQVGGSYNRMYGGVYGAQVGGTMGFMGPLVGTGAFSGGGFGTEITGASAAAIGGSGATASGARAVVLGGNQNTASGSDAVTFGNTVTNSGGGAIAGGAQNTNSGVYSVVVGFTLTNSGGYSGVLGRDNGNTKDYSLVTGRYAVGRTAGAVTLSSGRRSVSGDSQSQSVHMRVTTTDATAAYLQVADTGTFANVADTSNTVVSMLIAATNVADQSGGAWELKFRIKRTASVTTLLGSTLTPISVDASASGWAISVVPSNSASGYRISVTGAAATTINWSAVARDVCAG